MCFKCAMAGVGMLAWMFPGVLRSVFGGYSGVVDNHRHIVNLCVLEGQQGFTTVLLPCVTHSVANIETQ